MSVECEFNFRMPSSQVKLSNNLDLIQTDWPSAAFRSDWIGRQFLTIGDEDIRQRLQLGEDSRWEFRQIEFSGERPTGPRREDLADEMTAFANANGGVLFCGVTDEGQIQGMSSKQMEALDKMLVELSTDAINPPVQIDVHHRILDGKIFVLVEVMRGYAVHDRSGYAYIRVGSTKRRLDGDERLRLAQRRAQNRYIWFDQQVVPLTGFGTLDERLWEPLLSVYGANDPRQGLLNLRLLAKDEAGVERATNAGILLCTKSPQEWLPQATVLAIRYRGQDRASGQLEAKEIVGPLPDQIAAAVAFVTRNMQVAAHKFPARENVPQYSVAAVFEAVVNAVAHRDYSNTSRRIMLSMFKDRLEIDSPGPLRNGLTVEGMVTGQSTRNEVIASTLGRIPVGDVVGADHRRCLMERTGDGVSIILNETRKISGVRPEFRIVDESNLMLTIHAAKLELSPSDATVTVHSRGKPLSGAKVLALFPNKTWQLSTTDEDGNAAFDLYTTHLPMTVYAAAPGFCAGVEREWRPNEGGLLLELAPLSTGGAVIFPKDSGHLPGLQGRLNPKRDTSDRTYLYADNIAIEEGRIQPVPFRLGKPIRLTDAYGVEMLATIIDIVGRAALVEYRPFKP